MSMPPRAMTGPRPPQGGDQELGFVKVDQATLFDLILAANYFNIKGLLDLTCQTDAWCSATLYGFIVMGL
ncbi:hypothetical protein MLD38_022186 [Melastoma candidum]|uniref:Uncharacterized protein n=1 Tax=Melastoma candidum TaxID=119954 RepID=A0ACB9QJN7_9MYRT|nr:hypothetical protein MLD38_022186 [Melastoma candidum]